MSRKRLYGMQSKKRLIEASFERKKEYIKNLVNQFEAMPENMWYVPTRIRCGNTTYEGINFVQRWLNDMKAPHLLLLGGYGGGKTFFCNKLVSYFGQQWLEQKGNGFFPVIFPLGQIKSNRSLLNFIESHLEKLGLLPPSYQDQSWVSELDAPDCLMIFDELDEIGRELSPNQVRDLLDEISLLPFRSSRFLLSTRSHLFASSDNIKGVNKFGAWYDTSKSISLRTIYLIAELEDFKKAQKEKYIQKRLKAAAPEVKNLIGSVYGLEDLSARPLLLRMIVDSYVQLSHKKFREVSLWDLYDVYTKNIFTRRRFQTGASEDNLSEASKIIALQLFRTKKIWIDWNSLQNILKHSYLSKSQKESQRSDLSNASSDLLLHREGDLFRFSHLSLYDFFLAQALIDEVENHRLNILSNGALTPETLSFVFSAVRNKRRRLDWKWLVDSFNKHPTTGKRCWIIINLLSLFGGLRHDLLRKILPKALNSKDPEVLKKGLKIVGYFDCNGNHKSILRLLNSSDLEIRYLAIEAAGLHRISEASSIIIEHINTTDQNIRGISLWSLSKIRDEKAAQAAIDLLQTKDKAFLRAATGILGKRQETSALPFLRSLLKKGLTPWDRYYIEEAIDAITEKRKYNLSKLFKQIHAEPHKWLKFLKSCKRNWLKRYLIDEIGEQRLKEYADGLKEIYDREEPHIRHTIIDAIGEMRNDRNSQFLIDKFRTERNPIVRADIIWALGNGTDPRSLQIILQGLNDPSPLVQKWARWAQTQYTRMDAASNMALRYIYP